MPLPALLPLLAKAAPYIGSAVGGFLGSRSQSAGDTISTLDPRQQAIQGQTATTISNLLNSPSQYQGQVAAPITAAEQQALANAQRLGSLSQTSLENLINLDPQAFATQFRTEIAQPALNFFKQDVAPYLTEALPFSSQARANVLTRGLNDLQQNLLGQQFQAREAQRQLALNAIGQGINLNQSQTQLAGVPREIQQLGLDKEFNRFIAGNPNQQAGLNSALSFLGVNTQAIQQPQDRLAGLISGLTSGAQIGRLFQGGK